jgi:sRNA-binding regulator protein Hfq
VSKGPDGAATGRAREPEIPQEEFVNRKLIRPAMPTGNGGAAAAPAPERSERVHKPREKRPSILTPETTHAEAYYFQKQIQARTRMTMKLKNGEEITGVISWYDRHCLKVERSGKPDVLVYKQGIRFMHKVE